MRISIDGGLGSFHHAAALKWYGNDITIVPCESFKAVFEAIKNGQADAAMVAIENSFFGSINEVYDLLLKYKYPIVGEVPERIHQCLIGITDINFTEITHVYSQSMALAQCSYFIDSNLPQAKRVEHFDTAASVELISKLNDKQSVAIASSLAAKLHNCKVIKKGIENYDSNYTRFLALDPKAKANIKANKASLVLRTSHKPGALYKALGIFAENNANLTKLQSRPIPGKVWKYMFYIDFELAKDNLDTIIAELENIGCTVTFLGKYKSAKTIYE